jgi:hypothetical protein
VAEKRRSKRFDLRLPVEVFKIGDRHVKLRLQSRNISSRGVLIEDPGEQLEKGQQVEFYIELPTGDESVQVRILCRGAVVRRDRARQCSAAMLQRYEFERVAVRGASAGQ